MDCGASVESTRRGMKPSSRRAAVLLEVLLALGLFVFAAAVVSSGLTTAVDRTLRLRAQTHALDLAVSVFSELEMGLRPVAAAGPEAFEAPFEQWTWEIAVVPYTLGTEDRAGLQQVTVVVRSEAPPTVHRLTGLLLPPPRSTPEQDRLFANQAARARRQEAWR